MVSVTTTGFGAAAIDSLGRLLDQRRGGDPLAPGLVVCAKPLVAVGVRRALGRRSQGVAGVNVVTVDQLTEDLANPSLAAAGDHLATDIEVQAAVRAELQVEPGLFGRVADHRTTEERLVALHHQLAGLGESTLGRLHAAGTGLAGDAIRVMRGVRHHAGSARTRDHALELALDELGRLPTGALGPIIVYLPEPTRPLDGRLISALARRDDCDIIVGFTGDAAIDRKHLARLAVWSIQVETRVSGEMNPARINTATLLDVADPDDEVRAALRDVAAHAALGVPLSQMAVLYSATDPYATLLSEHLDGAGMPWCGPGRRPLASSLAGRFLLRMLELGTSDFDRASLITMISSAPVTDESGARVPAGVWDRLSRQAGVVDGDQWQPRLEELSHHLEGEDSESALALADFVERLRRRLKPEEPLQTWAQWAEWARAMMSDHLEAGDDWPDEESAARSGVDNLLSRLAVLDEFNRLPERAAVESIISAQLSRQTVPGRPLGRGLVVAPIDAVSGLGFERVIVLGLADGIFPRTPREDSLLPNKLRAESNGLLGPSETVTELDVRAVAAALAASRRPPLAITSRGDLRSIRSRSWPRSLDPLIGERAGLESHHRALADHGRPASLEDFGLRAMIAHVDGGDPVHTHELARTDQVLSDNLARVRSRSRSELNRHVGRVPAGTLDATDRLLSATALEAYASCPRKYLLGRVLRLGEEDRPERIDDITPTDRGTLMHAVLERFIAESIADGAIPQPDEPWPDERREHLHAILSDELALAQARGITGGRVNTMILNRRMTAEMELFLATDNELRAERRSTPHTVEIGFGIDDEPSNVELPDGRSVRLRGRVDRVDATEDGGVLVIDYKGGSKRSFDGMDDDPLDGGRRLQLPLYARVVAEKLGRTGPRTALYWLTRFGELKPMELEEGLESALDRTVAAALDGISGGLFPGIPGEAVGWPRLTFANCRYCDFDRICPTDRQREWEAVRQDDSLTPIDVLISGPGER